MYQVLIVDDEYLARNKLECILNWEEHGFCISNSVENGEEAIEYLKKNPVDVIFTDVCMPGVDGIELTKHVKEHYPDTKVVIMSSYSDFSYVRECFMADAADYILKHSISEASIAALLKKLSENYLPNVESQNRRSFDSYRKAQQYREHIINQLRGAAESEPVPGALVAAAKINNYTLLKQMHTQDELEVYYQNITNTIAKILKNIPGVIIFQNSGGCFIIFMPFGDACETTVMKELNGYIQKISYAVKKFFDLKLLWGFSRMSAADYSLSDCYAEAVNMLELTPVKGKKENETEFEFTSLSIKNEKNLLNAIQTMNYSSIDRVLVDIFEDLPINHLAVNIIVGELIAVANKICNELNINIDSINDNFSKFSSMARDNYSKEEIFDWNKNLFHCIVDAYTSQAKNSHKQQYSHLVRDYISKNYSGNINLRQIALNIGITESYLSTVFKDETGETISKYLTKFRIEKAKELLKEDVDIKYLYSLVGFKNYNYFFVAFKKIVGCTPIQFKKNCIHDKNI